MVLSGTLNPSVLRLGCNINRGTSFVAFKINVYEPGVNAFKRRKIRLLTRAYVLIEINHNKPRSYCDFYLIGANAYSIQCRFVAQRAA